MLTKLALLLLLFLPTCKHFSNLSLPIEIKATIDGELNGHKIQCEKTLLLQKGQWGLMCKVGNNMSINYFVNSLHDGQAKIEFQISKEKNGKSKVIASPSLLVKNKNNYWQNITSKNTNIMLMAERLK